MVDSRHVETGEKIPDWLNPLFETAKIKKKAQMSEPYKFEVGDNVKSTLTFPDWEQGGEVQQGEEGVVTDIARNSDNENIYGVKFGDREVYIQEHGIEKISSVKKRAYEDFKVDDRVVVTVSDPQYAGRQGEITQAMSTSGRYVVRFEDGEEYNFLARDLEKI
jgi:hypothetical protein